ncbi:MAG: helix-turn-helix domain-containing protein [Spirochaetaceae bacterium]
MEKFVPGVQGLLGRNIKSARARLNLSQQALAERADLSPGHINDLEQGRKWVSADALERIAEALLLEPFMLLLPPDYSSELDAFALLTEYASSVRERIEGALDSSLEEALLKRRPQSGDDAAE